MLTRPEAADPAVEELKRRARRRLVGAIVPRARGRRHFFRCCSKAIRNRWATMSRSRFLRSTTASSSRRFHRPRVWTGRRHRSFQPWQVTWRRRRRPPNRPRRRRESATEAAPFFGRRAARRSTPRNACAQRRSSCRADGSWRQRRRQSRSAEARRAGCLHVKAQLGARGRRSLQRLADLSVQLAAFADAKAAPACFQAQERGISRLLPKRSRTGSGHHATRACRIPVLSTVPTLSWRCLNAAGYRGVVSTK